MFAQERAEMGVFGRFYFVQVLVYCLHRTSLSFLDHAQSCKSVWNLLILVLFSGMSTQVFRVFFRKTDVVILSWGFLCAGHFILSDHELNVFFINPRTRLAFDAAEMTCSCQVPSDEMRTCKSLSHSVTPSFFLQWNNPPVLFASLSAWLYIFLNLTS